MPTVIGPEFGIYQANRKYREKNKMLGEPIIPKNEQQLYDFFEKMLEKYNYIIKIATNEHFHKIEILQTQMITHQ